MKQLSLRATQEFCRFSLLLICLSFPFLLAACDSGRQTDREATVAALGELVVKTATATAGDELSSQDLLATAEAAATEAVATISAVTTQAAASAATAAAIAAIPPEPQPAGTPPPPPGDSLPEAIAVELSLYGVNPLAGDLIWLIPELLLEGEGVQQLQAQDLPAVLPVQDFVLAADIVLGTESTACGYGLRAADLAQLRDQYLLLIDPSGSGQLVFQTWQNGALTPNEREGVLIADPTTFDPQFNLTPGSTNRLTVVAIGQTFSVYSNGLLVAEFVPVTELAAGLVTLSGISEAGTAVCQFSAAWLWQFNNEN
jgi:hypothetical protein